MVVDKRSATLLTWSVSLTMTSHALTDFHETWNHRTWSKDGTIYVEGVLVLIPHPISKWRPFSWSFSQLRSNGLTDFHEVCIV